MGCLLIILAIVAAFTGKWGLVLLFLVLLFLIG